MILTFQTFPGLHLHPNDMDCSHHNGNHHLPYLPWTWLDSIFSDWILSTAGATPGLLWKMLCLSEVSSRISKKKGKTCTDHILWNLILYQWPGLNYSLLQYSLYNIIDWSRLRWLISVCASWMRSSQELGWSRCTPGTMPSRSSSNSYEGLLAMYECACNYHNHCR